MWGSLCSISGVKVGPCNEGLPWWLSGKESACNAGGLGLILGSGRSPGGGHGNPLQYSGLENPMDSSLWGCKELDAAEPLSVSIAL